MVTPQIAGGGIFNFGSLVLDRAVLSDNRAFDGGGVRNDGGQLTVLNSAFIHNGVVGSQQAGGGIFSDGGGRVTLEGVEFRRNLGYYGAAILSASPSEIRRVVIEDNAGGLSGGILTGSTMTISDSTVSGNGSRGIINEGALRAENVTITGNTGDGLLNEGEASLVNATITGNAVGLNNHNTFAPDISPSLSVVNSIIADNSEANCRKTNPAFEPTTSLGHNLGSDGSCPFSGSGDMMNTDPQLGPLADNGGPTQTHALLAGSPAIDGGDNAACAAADQRGEPRPTDGNGDGVAACDIGAYEREGVAAPSPTVAPTVTPSAPPSPVGSQDTPAPTPAPSAQLPRALPRTGGGPAALARR